MSRTVGTISRGIRTPIIRSGDDLVKIVADSVIEASQEERFEIKDRDVIGVTEAVLARAQNNYVTVDDIAKDVKNKFGESTVGVIFPITSRNRFAICLRGIAKGLKKIVLMLNYPSDEVGNHLMTLDMLDEKAVNPYSDVLTLEQYRDLFGYNKHQFTGIDYVEYYEELIKKCGAEVEIIFANNPRTILKYTRNVIACDIHTRERTKRILKENGGKIIVGLDDILNKPIDGSGYNSQYGLLGSNKSTEDKVKLFPREAEEFSINLQNEIYERVGKKVEVLIYGDGAFKDPIGKIWELADPVVSPGYTKGLEGVPNEVKLKYLADNNFAHLSGEDLKQAISEHIKNKPENLIGSMEAQGTTPRRLVDLIGSLCDLTSGSGDKGTPVVYIQGYFDNYSN